MNLIRKTFAIYTIINIGFIFSRALDFLFEIVKNKSEYSDILIVFTYIMLTFLLKIILNAYLFDSQIFF